MAWFYRQVGAGQAKVTDIGMLSCLVSARSFGCWAFHHINRNVHVRYTLYRSTLGISIIYKLTLDKADHLWFLMDFGLSIPACFLAV